MEIKCISIDELFSSSTTDLLFSEYASESKTEVTTDVIPNYGIFKAMEQSGTTTVLGVFKDNLLVGFSIFVTSVSPHYSVLQTTITSIFILKDYRKGGTAKLLFSEIEKIARLSESKLIIVSSPIGATLGKYVPRLGYVPNNILHCKDLR